MGKLAYLLMPLCFWPLQAPDDNWEKYMLFYMAAIRDRFYPAPKQAAGKVTQADKPSVAAQANAAILRAA